MTEDGLYFLQQLVQPGGEMNVELYGRLRLNAYQGDQILVLFH